MLSLPKNLSVDKSWLYRLASEIPLDGEAVESALCKMGVLPDRNDWRNWLMLIGYGLGAALFLTGVIFFFAYNWENLHRFGRFTFVGSGVIISALAAYWSGLDKFSGKLWLTAASVLTGVLLAIFGMVYQTGADSYMLFASWAFLIFFWVFAARFQPLWLIWLVLINMAFGRWFFVISHHWPGYGGIFSEWIILLPVVVNGGILLIREKTTIIHNSYKEGRWFPRIIAFCLLGGLTLIPVEGIFSGGHGGVWVVLLIMYFVVLLAMIYFYLNVRHDLLMLTLAAISIIFVLTCGFIRVLFEGGTDIGGIFFVGLFILAETTIAARLLLTLSRKWKSHENTNG